MSRSPAAARLKRRHYARGVGDPFASMPADEVERLAGAICALIAALPPMRIEQHARSLHHFLAEHEPLFGVPAGRADSFRDPELDAAAVRDVCAALEAVASDAPTALDRRLDWLAATLALAEDDRTILGLFARVVAFKPWRKLAEAFGGGTRMRRSVVAALAGVSQQVVETQLAPGAPLIATGLIVDERDGDYLASGFLHRLTALGGDDAAALSAAMLPPAPPSTLDWADFAHHGEAVEIAARAIAAASGEAGVEAPFNLLLHGVPGTGKSEFARALADRLGLSAVFAGLAEEDGGEPDRASRLAHLTVLRALTRTSATHLVVVDEADDVLALHGDERARKSKLWLNRLVETPGAPTVWIVNDPAQLGDTIVRRMTHAIGFRLPPVRVRARIVAKHAANAGVPLSAQEIGAAAALPAFPAVLANAAAAARLAGGGGETLRRAAEGIVDALGLPLPRPYRLPDAYDPALAHADQDLAALADRLAAAPSRGWSLLLGGPSGTGKSAYAHHLAARLGIEVEERRGSDLLSPFVGGTEANIARAFRDAGEAGALLLIDEADVFLFDRAGAERSWESSMVAEMLRWMEDARSPFIATTNFADRLDPATQRRFTLRASFRPLPASTAAVLFARWFGEPAPAGEGLLDGLVPGDFALAARRAEVLGEARREVLAAWLREEAAVRGGRARAGFHRPHAPAPIPRHEERAANDRADALGIPA